ncbi:uncharacterized protein LOC143154396 isoform X2 [Ptiloglossa arizonensis]|uniref:uncharacterized protein LOC143154396 isoform X2 n=1 Tax=Ptiloglossa arizonensis TaxID=3350558 RepID=UPI003FA04EE5
MYLHMYSICVRWFLELNTDPGINTWTADINRSSSSEQSGYCFASVSFVYAIRSNTHVHAIDRTQDNTTIISYKMSSSSWSSSNDQSRERQLATNRISLMCSTPMKKGTTRPLSISVSAVDTNSSSSMSKIRKILIAQSPVRKQRKLRKMQETKLRRKHRKKKALLPTNVDSNWVTEWEVSADENVNFQQTPTKRGTSGSEALFQDLPSPEHTREAYHVIHDRLQSPILQSRQKKAESPVKIDSDDDYEPFSPTDTTHLLLRINYPTDKDKEDLEDTESEEIFFSNYSFLPKYSYTVFDCAEWLIARIQISGKEHAVKTYSRPRQLRQTKKVIEPKDKSKQWIMDVAIPTTSSDILWDDYVKDHPEEMHDYVASPATRAKLSKVNRSSEKKRNTSKQRKNRAKMKNYEKGPVSSLIWPEVVIPTNMKMMSATMNRFSKTWIANHDVYDFFNSKERDLDRDNVTGTRISLNEFCRRCKAEKDDS